MKALNYSLTMAYVLVETSDESKQTLKLVLSSDEHKPKKPGNTIQP